MKTLALCFVIWMFSVAPASAAPLFVGWGTTVTPVGPLTPKQIQAFERSGFKPDRLGYEYSFFGLFGLEVWTWKGTFCVYHDLVGGVEGRYIPLSDEAARALMAEAGYTSGVPFFYRFPGALVLIAAGLIVGSPAALIIRRVRSREAPPPSIQLH